MSTRLEVKVHYSLVSDIKQNWDFIYNYSTKSKTSRSLKANFDNCMAEIADSGTNVQFKIQLWN